MVLKKEVDKFLSNQKSIQFYNNIKIAFSDVLIKMSNKDFRKVTKNLILMVLHEGAIAQVMHFKLNGKFQVLQLNIPDKAPISVLRYVITHEFGHVLQGRNWKESDGSDLEYDAEKFTKKLGFYRTKSIDKWIKKYSSSFECKLSKLN